MDGLECSEVTLNRAKTNKDFRIDSGFYTTKLYKNTILNYTSIGSCLLESKYGISIDMNDVGKGYPIYRMNEIHNMLCDLVVSKYADTSAAEFQKFKLNDGDVLFNRTNSYDWVGRTGIYYDIGTPQIYASYLVRFVPEKSKIQPEYLTAFLSCKYGVADVKRRARQSINQTNVNPEEVKEIAIPLLSESIQDGIRDCFQKAHRARLSAQQMYSQAEQQLSLILGFNNLTVSQQAVSIKSLSESFGSDGRLDAEYYQSKYDDYKAALKTEDTVYTLCNLHDKNFVPKTDVEYGYIELANVGNSGNINDVDIALGKNLPSRARRKVKSGQVIIASVEGSLQSCALITDEYSGALCSTGFYVVDSDYINPESLLVLFKSETIQALLKQRCSGTILTAITKDEFLSMPLPKIEQSVQEQIAAKVQESFALRHQSDQLLENAKRAVEIAIEQGEDKAIEWLKEKGVEG
jgi:type I restriction enzyme S subunit